jgi:hypothetical protein
MYDLEKDNAMVRTLNELLIEKYGLERLIFLVTFYLIFALKNY